MIHIEFSWDRLNEVSATNRDDAKASAEGLELLDGPDEVVSGVRKSNLKPLCRSGLTRKFQLCHGQTILRRFKACTAQLHQKRDKVKGQRVGLGHSREIQKELLVPNLEVKNTSPGPALQPRS